MTTILHITWTNVKQESVSVLLRNVSSSAYIGEMKKVFRWTMKYSRLSFIRFALDLKRHSKKVTTKMIQIRQIKNNSFKKYWKKQWTWKEQVENHTKSILNKEREIQKLYDKVLIILYILKREIELTILLHFAYRRKYCHSLLENLFRIT